MVPRKHDPKFAHATFCSSYPDTAWDAGCPLVDERVHPRSTNANARAVETGARLTRQVPRHDFGQDDGHRHEHDGAKIQHRQPISTARHARDDEQGQRDREGDAQDGDIADAMSGLGVAEAAHFA